MKYISIDLETTGLIPAPENILMVSMVAEDTKNIRPLKDLPNFTCLVDVGEVKGSAYALGLNGWILDYISGRNKNVCPYVIYNAVDWIPKACEFIVQHSEGKAIAAGKNVASFDMKFLPKEITMRFHHRVIDPGPIFIDWENDSVPPDLGQCKDRVGLAGPITHDAYEDALEVIAVLRTKYVK